MTSMFSQTNNIQIQQEIQQQQPQSEAQAQIQYYVFQDLQYVINLLYQMKAVAQHFKNSENTMVKLCNNKLMLQLNISFGIHLDQQQQCEKNSRNLDFLLAQKNTAKGILESIIQKMSDNEKELLKEQLNWIDDYKTNCLGQKINWKQYPLKITNLTPQFNEQVLQQLIHSIQQVDNQVTHMKQNHNSSFSLEQIEKTAQQYEIRTQDQLNRRFPNVNNSTCNINGNEFIQVDKQNLSNYNNTYNSNSTTQYNNQNNQKLNLPYPDLMNSDGKTEFQNYQLADVLSYFEQSNLNYNNILQQISNDYDSFINYISNHLTTDPSYNQLMNYKKQGYLREQFKFFQIFKIYHYYLQQSQNQTKQFVQFLQSYSYKNQCYNDFINYIKISQEVINQRDKYIQWINYKSSLNPEYSHQLYQKFLLVFQERKR